MRIPFITLIAASCLAVVSCDSDEKVAAPQPSSGPVESWPATRSTEGGNFDVTLTPEGGAIDSNTHFALAVKVAAKSGDMAGVKVVVDADMPAHGHGMNTKPETSAIDDGTFRTEGMLLHMIGDWIITVDVTRDGKTERATFPVSVE